MSFNGYEHVNHPDLRNPEAYFSYTCGHCGEKTSGIVVAHYNFGFHDVKWLICTSCGDGSVYSNDGNIYPSSIFGPDIEGLPSPIDKAYKEARDCMSTNAYNACELICRKILMHIAVEKGAQEKESFAFYIDYLAGKGYVTPPMTDWVDLIREHGGKATHLIEEPDENRAESTLMFTAELLRLTYEMEYLTNQYKPKK